jgi:alkanesulfonate monooxygenase SsuD/methylene tetrahydromethanopterin reductase-like flavin-dependent oxidoreductase (luciferase family)
MKLGALLMPSRPPERSVRDGQRWDPSDLERRDALGFEEAWIGEYFIAAWEPSPAPDLLIAQALLRTKRIRLGPLGYLLPFHHPFELAHRVAYLDHMAEGRYQVGIGVVPTDHALFALDVSGGRNRRMTFEAIDMMTRLWTEGATDFQGEYCSMGETSSELAGLGHHLFPYQKPHPPIAIAALTAGSENHKLAGEQGYIPVSLGIDPDASITAKHWDAEAREFAIGGIMGRCWREFPLTIYLGLGLGRFLKHDPSMPDEAVDLAYLADNLWFVGSPPTVADRILNLQAQTGGFGHLTIVSYDATGEEAAWESSLEMLMNDVLPICRSASPGAERSTGVGS